MRWATLPAPATSNDPVPERGRRRANGASPSANVQGLDATKAAVRAVRRETGNSASRQRFGAETRSTIAASEGISMSPKETRVRRPVAGFTLLELLVVVLIIGLLAGFVAP